MTLRPPATQPSSAVAKCTDISSRSSLTFTGSQMALNLGCSDLGSLFVVLCGVSVADFLADACGMEMAFGKRPGRHKAIAPNPTRAPTEQRFIGARVGLGAMA